MSEVEESRRQLPLCYPPPPPSQAHIFACIMADGYTTLPSGRGSPRPGSPLTPRTLNSRIAWWLGLCSLLFSTLALLNSSVFVQLPGGRSSSTVRVITLRMSPNGMYVGMQIPGDRAASHFLRPR